LPLRSAASAKAPCCSSRCAMAGWLLYAAIKSGVKPLLSGSLISSGNSSHIFVTSASSPRRQASRKKRSSFESISTGVGGGKDNTCKRRQLMSGLPQAAKQKRTLNRTSFKLFQNSMPMPARHLCPHTSFRAVLSRVYQKGIRQRSSGGR